MLCHDISKNLLASNVMQKIGKTNSYCNHKICLNCYVSTVPNVIVSEEN